MTIRLPGMLLLAVLLASFGTIASLRGDRQPVQAAAGTWTGEYFDNPWLAGTPVFQRDEGDLLDLAFSEWIPPVPGVTAQNFSARWTRADVYDTEGLYRFVATTDDGMRLSIDDEVVLDEWWDQPETVYVVERWLSAGGHEFKVEYYNREYEGVARLIIERVDEPSPTATETPPPTATPSETPRPAVTAAARTAAAPRTGTAAVTRTGTPATAAARTASVTVSPTGVPSTPAPGSTAPPRIGCAWELPDMNSRAPGIQYLRLPDGRARSGEDHDDDDGAETDDAELLDRDDASRRPSRHVHDDDMAVVPDADGDPSNGLQKPCSGPPLGAPAQSDGVRHMIQVVPNLEDQPEPRRIELWLSADHPDGVDAIAGVFWAVYRPDGSKMSVAPGRRLPSEDCAALGRAGRPAGSMFEAAVHTGQLSARAVNAGAEGLLDRCRFGRSAFFSGDFALGKDEPCGEYRLAGVAMSTGGVSAGLTTHIDVLCVFGMKLDFRSLDWGAVDPGARKQVAGDARFDPAGGVVPTLMNIGNDGMGLKLRFSAMVSASRGSIDEFDSCFGRTDTMMQCLNPIRAGSVASFDTDPRRVLCADEAGRIDFAIQPGSSLAPDVYRGLVTLIGVHVPGECAGDRHLR